LGISGKLNSRGTVLTVNNIINRVFWVTIVALLAWLAVGLFGKSSQQTVADSRNSRGNGDPPSAASANIRSSL
jgi:hypothetical protein